MLVKIEQDLFRVLELQHVTPGNLRGFVRVKFRNIRSGALADQKLRSEDSVERATLDEREMQYLYHDGDMYYFMDTATYDQVHITAEALGDSKDYLVAEMLIRVEFYEVEPVGIELPPTVDLVDRLGGNEPPPAREETGADGERIGLVRARPVHRALDPTDEPAPIVRNEKAGCRCQVDCERAHVAEAIPRS